jgi:hypothetical protein
MQKGETKLRDDFQLYSIDEWNLVYPEYPLE